MKRVLAKDTYEYSNRSGFINEVKEYKAGQKCCHKDHSWNDVKRITHGIPKWEERML